MPPGQPPSAETRTARVGGQPSALTSSARWRTRGRPPVPCWVRPRLPLADASVRVAFVAQRANRLAPGVRWRTRATFPGARPHRRAAEPLPPRRAAILPPDSDRLLLAVNPPARVSRSSEGASRSFVGPFPRTARQRPSTGLPLAPKPVAARRGTTRAHRALRRPGGCSHAADGCARWPLRRSGRRLSHQSLAAARAATHGARDGHRASGRWCRTRCGPSIVGREARWARCLVSAAGVAASRPTALLGTVVGC